MSFTRRLITIKFKLGEGRGDLGTAGQDIVTIEGLRCSVNVVHEGIQFARADVQVWGMSLDLMNKLTVTQKFFWNQTSYNSIEISAGDEKGQSVCFSGGVLEAWADVRQQPDAMFHVSAASGLVDLSQTIAPTSYKSGVDVATAVEGIAKQIGYSFENNGVTGTFSGLYKPGSPKAQIESICRDVGCNWTVDDTSKVVAIWPERGARAGEAVRIAPDTGLVSYPAFAQGGLQFSTLYNPALEYGRLVRVESPFEAANGQWTVRALAHRLESNIPDGQWFTDIETSYLDAAA